MKICKKCHTKNDNRKKKCSYCGASLKGVKIKEDSKIYMSTYKGIYDITETDKETRTIKNLSEQFFMFVIAFFIINLLFNVCAYYFIDVYFNNLDALMLSFIYQCLRGIIINTLSLLITFGIVFWKYTIYEADFYKFLISLGFYFGIYSIFLGAINFMQYGSFNFAFIVFAVNFLIFLIYLPIINVILKEKLL